MLKKFIKKAKIVLRKIFGNKISKQLSKMYLIQFMNSYIQKQNIHLNSIFLCDFYQNNKDIIDYTEYNGLTVEKIRALDQEFKIMSDVIKKGDTVLDIGANIGLYTIGLSTLVGETGKVHSFEPGPISYAILSRNIYANIFAEKRILNDNIILNNCAVSDRDTISNLFINISGESDNQVHHNIERYEFKHEGSRNKILTKTVSLDNYFLNKSTSISYIKIDTQGHEYYVLKGGKKILTESSNVVLTVEYAPYLKSWEKYSQDDFYALIISMGFKIYDLVNEIQEVDNNYLKKNYSAELYGKYTTLILKK